MVGWFGVGFGLTSFTSLAIHYTFPAFKLYPLIGNYGALKIRLHSFCLLGSIRNVTDYWLYRFLSWHLRSMKPYLATNQLWLKNVMVAGRYGIHYRKRIYDNPSSAILAGSPNQTLSFHYQAWCCFFGAMLPLWNLLCWCLYLKTCFVPLL